MYTQTTGPKTISKVLTLILIATYASSVVLAAPHPDDELASFRDDTKKILKAHMIEMADVDTNPDDDMDNKLFPYDPKLVESKQYDRKYDTRRANNVITNSFGDLERESASANHHVVSREEIVKRVAPPTLPSTANEQTKTALTNQDKIKSIAFNNREVRLMGPDQREVEMKSDVGTQLYVVLDNLQKEASEVWDQVSEKLDKGWTDLKKMVETAVAPSSAKQNRG